MLSTSATLQHITPIPDAGSAARLIALLHGHEAFIKCDPHMTSYSPIPTPADSPEPVIPGYLAPLTALDPPPQCYRVVDKVAALPAGIWKSDVESVYEFINCERGVFVRIRSPLSVLMETYWEVRDGSDGGKGQLVEHVKIQCSRLLIGFVKSTCESGWTGIHEKLMAQACES